MPWKSWELYHSTLHHPAQSYPVLNASRIDETSAAIDRLSQWWTRQRAGRPHGRRQRGFHLRGSAILKLFSVLLMLVFCALFPSLITFLYMRLELLLLLLLYVVVFFSTIAPGFNLAMKVSGLIYDEQAKGRYDLLSLTPRGSVALHLALAIRCNRRDRIATTMRSLIFNLGAWLSLPTAAFLIPMLILALIMLVIDRSAESVTFFTTISLPLLLLTLYYVDYIQSSVIAFLLAVIVPAWLTGRSRVWMSWVAPLTFVAIQVMSYMLFLIAFLYTNSLVWNSTTRDAEMQAFLLVVLQCGLMFAVREALVTALWRMAIRLFGDDLLVLRVD